MHHANCCFLIKQTQSQKLSRAMLAVFRCPFVALSKAAFANACRESFVITCSAHSALDHLSLDADFIDKACDVMACWLASKQLVLSCEAFLAFGPHLLYSPRQPASVTHHRTPGSEHLRASPGGATGHSRNSNASPRPQCAFFLIPTTPIKSQ